MKALTVYQPWASLIALGEKRIETRGWYTKYRGPLAIHAAATCKAKYMDLAWQEPFYSALLPLHKPNPTNPTLKAVINYPWMSIIGICNLVDCVSITSEFVAGLSVKERVFGDYTLGRFAWTLKDVYPLKEPIAVRGRQRLWNWDETEHQICIDPFIVGGTRIWTPRGVRSGKTVAKPDEDAVMGLEVRA
ncbi:ASCH domain-containing protein [Syntrophomonas erecta subsp. sporosyntropha]